ncbi:mannosyltransferase family protein [Dictyobacter aurantiacus]|nr:mannosyltransferase family protein [Dictyobacter aurantiacus]
MKQKLKKQMILLPLEEPSPTIIHKIISAPAWKKWLKAARIVFPFYLAIHMGMLVLDCLSTIITRGDAYQKYPVNTLWTAWLRWDAQHYLYIALNGYPLKQETAFFPLYPLLISIVNNLHLSPDPIIAQLIVSNLAWLAMMVVFYQLVRESMGTQIAWRAIIYHSIFPTAFFLAAGYNESLLLCLVLLSFYQLHHGNWWLAGTFGFFACLARSTGILLIISFAYEYLRQHNFNIRQSVRPSMLSILLLPAGLSVFMAYTTLLYGDYLSFMHVQALWSRQLSMPWVGIVMALRMVYEAPFLSFQSLRNLTDLIPDLFIMALLIMGWVGPWKLPRKDWSYLIFGTTLWLFFQLTPLMQGYPLGSMGRFMLEVFPAFIIAARIGTNKSFHFNYICVALAMYAYLIIAFLVGYWVL